MYLNLIGILIVVCTFFTITYYEKQKTGIISVLSNWIPGILLSFILPAIITNSFGKSIQVSIYIFGTGYNKKCLLNRPFTKRLVSFI